MSMMVSFLCCSFSHCSFPTRCLGWDLELIWVSSWGFSFLLLLMTQTQKLNIFIRTKLSAVFNMILYAIVSCSTGNSKKKYIFSFFALIFLIFNSERKLPENKGVMGGLSLSLRGWSSPEADIFMKTDRRVLTPPMCLIDFDPTHCFKDYLFQTLAPVDHQKFSDPSPASSHKGPFLSLPCPHQHQHLGAYLPRASTCFFLNKCLSTDIVVLIINHIVRLNKSTACGCQRLAAAAVR